MINIVSIAKYSERNADSSCKEIEDIIREHGFTELELPKGILYALDENKGICSFTIYKKNGTIINYSALNIESVASPDEIGLSRYANLFNEGKYKDQCCAIDYVLLESDSDIIEEIKHEAHEIGWSCTKVNINNLIIEEIENANKPAKKRHN
jgi:hypothetical protein